MPYKVFMGMFRLAGAKRHPHPRDRLAARALVYPHPSPTKKTACVRVLTVVTNPRN